MEHSTSSQTNAPLYFAPPQPEAGSGQEQHIPIAEAYKDHAAGSRGNVMHQPGYTLPPPPPRPDMDDFPSQSALREQAQADADAASASYEQPPQKPPRPQYTDAGAAESQELYGSGAAPQQYNPSIFSSQQAPPDQGGLYVPPLPPRRHSQNYGDDDPSNPIHYTRDPHKLVAYLVPFPKPRMTNVDPSKIPDRFLIYTPPPPPLSAPGEDEKEAKLHKVQRKWQEEVRAAKTSTAKTASWQGVKSKATRGINKAMGYTTSSNLDFLGRVSNNPSRSRTPSPGQDKDNHANDGVHQHDETHKTVGVEEMVLIYPRTMPLNQMQMREEFVNTMLRTKSKAQRDAIISTGLMPVAYGIDILATFVWPFGGLGEIDTVWAYANIRGAKTARSVTKRLSSSTAGNTVSEEDKLKLTFTPSPRLEMLQRYLAADCHKTDAKLFPEYAMAPTETDVLEAIGWRSAGEHKNWEDEQWEMSEVKEDLRLVMHKGGKEWAKWCRAFEKDPEKAMKK